MRGLMNKAIFKAEKTAAKQTKAIGKKGNLGAMTLAVGSVIGFLVLVLITALFGDVMTSIRNGQSAAAGGSYGYNVTSAGLDGLAKFSGQFGNVGLILAIGLIISVIVGAVLVFNARR